MIMARRIKTVTKTATKTKSNPNNFLANHFLIAMPTLTDPYFTQGVAYICEHNEKGAIGIVINHPLELHLAEVFRQMDITVQNPDTAALPVLCGGPVHPERGFVIHSPSGNWRSSLEMNSEIHVTTSRDILQAIAENQGPSNAIITLGYANWTAGQLEQEIINNYWITCPVDLNILFKLPYAERWKAAVKLVGIDLDKLVSNIGHA
jgi:putative transcriptional regulator